MKYLRMRTIAMLGLGTMLLGGLALAQQSRPSSHPERWDAVDAKMRAPFTLRGKVVDFDGNPVEGADVTVDQDRWYLDGREVHFKANLKTSTSGEFDLSGESMTRLSIEIKKDGYEFNQPKNPSYFDTDGLWPDPNRREIYRLRKRETPAYVTTRNIGWTVEDLAFDRTYRIELFGVNGGGITEFDPTDIEFPTRFHTDLECTMRPAEEEDWYIITMRAIEEDGGIQQLDKELFKAPDTGYQKEIDVKIRNERGTPKPVYVYMKTGKPSRYARLALVLRGPQERLHVGIECLTNPFGEQSLEYDQELSQFPEVRKILHETVRAAYREGKQPVKPDVKKMKDEARAKRKEKELQRQQATSSAPAGVTTTTTAPAK